MKTSLIPLGAKRVFEIHAEKLDELLNFPPASGEIYIFLVKDTEQFEGRKGVGKRLIRRLNKSLSLPKLTNGLKAQVLLIGMRDQASG